MNKVSHEDQPPLVGGFSLDINAAIKIPLHCISLLSVQLYSNTQ